MPNIRQQMDVASEVARPLISRIESQCDVPHIEFHVRRDTTKNAFITTRESTTDDLERSKIVVYSAGIQVSHVSLEEDAFGASGWIEVSHVSLEEDWIEVSHVSRLD